MGHNQSHIKSVFDVINELDKSTNLINVEELSELFK